MDSTSKLQPGSMADWELRTARRGPAACGTRLSPEPAPTPARNSFAALLPALVFSCCFALFISNAGGADARNATTISFKPEVVLPGPAISLSQVAEVAGPAAEKLQALDLGPVPWPGTQRLIYATVVKIKLFREGLDLGGFAFKGDGCVVTVKTQIVPGADILEAARKLLLERLPWPEESVEIELEAQPADQEVIAGSSKPVLEAAMLGDVAPGGKVHVSVTGSVDGTAIFRTTVSFQVRVLQTVIVARCDIAHGELFSADNLTERRLDVSTLTPGNLLDASAQLIGKKAARLVRAGMPITRQMVIVPPVVKRGGVVQIIYKTDFMVLSARGVAQEDGIPGKVIRVRNVDSAREVVGEVLSNGQVSVSF